MKIFFQYQNLKGLANIWAGGIPNTRVVQVICMYTSASNPNSSYGVKIWGYIDFSRLCVGSILLCSSWVLLHDVNSI